MPAPPKVVIPGLNRGAGIAGGYVIGRRRGTGQGPAQLLSLLHLSELGIATTAENTKANSSTASTAQSATNSLSSSVSTSLSQISSSTSVNTSTITSLSTAVSTVDSGQNVSLSQISSSLSGEISTDLSRATSLSTVISGSISTVNSRIDSLSTAGGGGGGTGTSTSLSQISSSLSGAISSTSSLSSAVSTVDANQSTSLSQISSSLSTEISVDLSRINSLSTAIGGGGGGISLILPGGRLTLASGTPVLASDATAQATVYYTPYQTDLIPIYSGSAWAAKTFPELTLTLDTTNHVSGSLYDVFVWNNSGAISIGTGPAWSSSTSRGTGAGTTELQMLDGIWTNKNSITLKNGAGAGTTGIAANTATYVGTFYATANGQTGMAFKPAAAAGGTNNFLALSNAYNRVLVGAVSRDSTASWTYAVSTWRSQNNSASNRVSFVDGLQQSTISSHMEFHSNGSSITSNGGANLDSTSAAPGVAGQINTSSTATLVGTLVKEIFTPQIGLHYIQAMELRQTGTCNFYGANTGGQLNALTVELEM